MAELHPPEALVNPVTTTVIAPAPAAAADTNHYHNLGSSLAPKRQRRPSVRLGEIGGDPPFRTWGYHRDPSTLVVKSSSSKVRPLTNLVNGDTGATNHDSLLDSGQDNPEFWPTTCKSKSKRPVKRVRTSWRVDNNGGGVNEEDDNNVNFRGNNDMEEEFIDVSDSPVKEQSLEDNVDFWQRRPPRVRVSESVDPESNSRDRKCGTSEDRTNAGFVWERGPQNGGFVDDGVRDWLIGLGLGRYAPVFEIHEVDDEVLPMLTMEDLKDMGINAIGSRRKMYTSILKLGKGFS